MTSICFLFSFPRFLTQFLLREARHLSQFAGYTHRVAELFDVLADVNSGKYERTMVTTTGAPSTAAGTRKTVDTNELRGRRILQDHVRLIFYPLFSF